MKKVLMTMLTAGLAFAMIGNTGTAYADESATTSHEGRSEASVTFQAPTEFETIAPLDPTNPDNPEYKAVDGNIPKLPEIKSGLSIDYVSHIDFGKQELSLEKKSYNAKTRAPYIQVTDQRFTENGWNLTAKASSFVLVKDEKRTEKSTLNGASISFTEPATAAKKEIIENNKIEAPNTGKFDLVTGADAASVADARSIQQRNSENAQGLGTWLLTWIAAGEEEDYNENDGNGNIVLHVPASVGISGNHVAEIVWTLSDGPAGNVSAEEDKVATDRY